MISANNNTVPAQKPFLQRLSPRTGLLVMIVLCLGIMDANAQQLSRMVLSSAGRDVGTASVGVSWTLGQIETMGMQAISGTDTVRTTLGFQQSYRTYPTATTTLSIDRVAAAAGDHVYPAIHLDRDEDPITRPFGPEKLRIQLTYNPTILYFNSASSGVAITKNEIQGALGFIEMQVDVEQDVKNQILGELDFTAALGNDSVCVLDITSVTPTTQNIGLIVIDGWFELLGLCRAGGARLLDVGGTVAISSIAPHPVRGSATVTFEVSEFGRATLQINDVNGRLVHVMLDAIISPSRYEVTLPVRDMADGWYELVLQTGAYSIRKPFLVSR